MAHMIDMSNNQANIAYLGETPWHKLGYAIQPGDEKETWIEKGGLAHEVLKSPAMYTTASGEVRSVGNRVVLYRSDTLEPLSVVSTGYNVVQPRQLVDFFDNIAEANNFTLETVGSLDGGARIWAMVKVKEGATVIGQDVVNMNLLLATSYDGSLATVGKYTGVRVVCNNTIQVALGEGGGVRIPHSTTFDPEQLRLDLGIANNAWEKFLIESRMLAKREVNDNFATAFLKQLLPPSYSMVKVDGRVVPKPRPVEETKSYQSIMNLFKGEAMGADLPEARGTAWGLLNAVTQHVDWEAGRTDNTRIKSAWFGVGNDLKSKARDMLVEIVT